MIEEQIMTFLCIKCPYQNKESTSIRCCNYLECPAWLRFMQFQSMKPDEDGRFIDGVGYVKYRLKGGDE